MTTKLARLMGALFIVVLVAVACGDDDDQTTAAGGGDAAAAADEAAADGEMDDMADGSMDDMADGDMDDMADGSMDDMDDGDMDHEHDHGDGIEVPDSMAVPEISVAVTPDPKAGQNLQVTLDNFEISPENASLDPIDGQGHLHLYVDGERQMRFYNEWLHLDLPPGDHTVEVEVSANNHSAYLVDGVPIRAAATVVVPEPEDDGHSHGHSEGVNVAAADAPTIEVEVFEDPKSGWNVHAMVTNLVLAPERASTDHVAGEGHMHLYVDGVKITRLYGPWWHLAELTEGDHEITVEASANTHAPYTVDGQPVTATVTVSVSADKASGSRLEPVDEGHGSGEGHGDGSGEDDMATGADADVMIPVTFAGGEVTVDDDRIGVARGDVVMVMVTSDVAEHVHVHGYDLFADVAPGETTTLVFTADVPGVFEIEFEDSFTFITELEVR